MFRGMPTSQRMTILGRPTECFEYHKYIERFAYIFWGWRWGPNPAYGLGCYQPNLGMGVVRVGG